MKNRVRHLFNCLLLAGVWGGLFSACHEAKKSAANPPNVDSLRESLKRAAESALPAPSLVNQRLAVRVTPGEVESAMDQIKRIGTELGAAIIPEAADPAQPGAKLLLRIPEERVAEFARRTQATSLKAATQGTESAPGSSFNTRLANPVEPVLVEVTLQAQPAAAGPNPEPQGSDRAAVLEKGGAGAESRPSSNPDPGESNR